jgi:hypothetical protein
MHRAKRVEPLRALSIKAAKGKKLYEFSQLNKTDLAHRNGTRTEIKLLKISVRIPIL